MGGRGRSTAADCQYGAVDADAGSVALITGGGRGIGRAVALALAGAGMRVAVLARSTSQLDAVAAEIEAAYGAGRALVLTADLAAPEAAAAAVAEVAANWGRLDVLVNNAGVVWPLGRVLAVDPDEWVRSIEINLGGAFRCIRAALPRMVIRGYGRIVNITSGAASPPGMPSATAYSAGKAGLEMLTVGLARELAGSGVTVNALRPGVVDSAMQDYMRARPAAEVGEGFVTRFHGLHQRGELLDPAVPAAVLVRLVATERTGQVIDVRTEPPIG